MYYISEISWNERYIKPRIDYGRYEKNRRKKKESNFSHKKIIKKIRERGKTSLFHHALYQNRYSCGHFQKCPDIYEVAHNNDDQHEHRYWIHQIYQRYQWHASLPE